MNNNQDEKESRLAKEVKGVVEDGSARLDQARRNTKHLDQLMEEGY